MTFNDFMCNLKDEVDSVVDEIALESIMFDFYTTEHEFEMGVATESLVLFEDEYESNISPAFEEAKTSFFQKIKNGFKKVGNVFKNIGIALRKFISRIKVEAKLSCFTKPILVHEINEIKIENEDYKFKRNYREADDPDGSKLRKHNEEISRKIEENDNAYTKTFMTNLVKCVDAYFTTMTMEFDRIVKIENNLTDIFNRCMTAKINTTEKNNTTIGEIYFYGSQDGITSDLTKFIKAAAQLTKKSRHSLWAIDGKLIEYERAFNQFNDYKNNITAEEFKKLQESHAKNASKIKINDLKTAAENMASRCDEFAAKTNHMSNTFDRMANGDENSRFNALAKIFASYSGVANHIVYVTNKFIHVMGNSYWMFSA